MFRNYIKLALRSLFKNKVYSSINLVGLAVGMACCLIIVLYVLDELSYDKFHSNTERIYRLLHHYNSEDNIEDLLLPNPEEFQVWGNAPVGPTLANDLPEIEQFVRFTSPHSVLVQRGERRFQEDIVFMDSTFFQVFDFPLLQGDIENVLVAPNSIVLSESMAKKYFGKGNVMGQTLHLENEEPLTITGVMRDPPENSHLKFDLLVSMSTFQQARPEIFEALGYVDFYTYILANKEVSISSLQQKIPLVLNRHFEDKGYSVSLEPLADAYLFSKATRQPGDTGNLSNIFIFTIVAAFILFIACSNYVNLATARSMDRAREVGIRKVAGADQKELILQFLLESIFICLMAAIVAFVLAALAFPLVHELTGKIFGTEMLFSWEVIFSIIACALIVGIIAGIYPALVLARFKPILVLRGVFQSSQQGIVLRKGLIVIQFALSVALLASTAIVYNQLDYLRNRDLGYQQEQMLVIDFGGNKEVQSNIEVIKQTIQNHPGVISVSSSRSVPGDFIPNAWTEIQSADGTLKGSDPLLYEVDAEFIENFKITMLAGRSFSRDFPSDSAQALLLNKSAAELYGYTDPKNAVGKPFIQWGREGTIIGVVEDFNFQSLHTEVEPLVLRWSPKGSLSKLSVLMKPESVSQTMGELEKTWSQLAPQRPFLYNFLDESFNEQYRKDVKFGKVFAVFSGFAIFIACLGLFGLVAYTAQQRKKEIGIRKVLGASVIGIISLLSKDLMKLILLASLIAIPVSWYFMQQWLNDFSYRIEISSWSFIGAGLLAAIIALLTIIIQGMKVATSSPVKNLKIN